MWQDYIFTVGSWCFSIALIPTIIGKTKPAISSIFITAFILSLYAVTFWTMGLWKSAVSTVMVAMCWWILMIQEIRRIKKRGPNDR